MKDLEEIREAIIDARESAEDDPVRQFSVAGLTRLYNRVAPPERQPSSSTGVVLDIRPSRPLPGREVGQVVELLSRAVASVGQEVLRPDRARSNVVRSDYDRVPFHVDVQRGGAIRLLAPVPADVMATVPVEGLTVQAMTRLVNLLPFGAHDVHVEQRVESARPSTARALREVAAAAVLADGLTVQLRGAAEPVTAVVEPAQADLIERVLKGETTEVSSHSYRGRLDGVRYSRRLFFLERSHATEIVGSVDEALVPRLLALLNRPVIAHVEKVVRRDAAGRHGRPAYRLVGIDEEPSLPADVVSA